MVALGSVFPPRQALQDSVLPWCVTTDVLEEGKLIPVPGGHLSSLERVGFSPAFPWESVGQLSRGCSLVLQLRLRPPNLHFTDPTLPCGGTSCLGGHPSMRLVTAPRTWTTSPGAGGDPTSTSSSFKWVPVWFQPLFHTRMLQCWDNLGPQVPSPLMQRKVCRGR